MEHDFFCNCTECTDGVYVEPPKPAIMEENMFVAYARNYGCSVAKAIGDRDWAMNREQCQEAFFEAVGRPASDAELDEMRPDSQAAYEAFMDEERRSLSWFQ